MGVVMVMLVLVVMIVLAIVVMVVIVLVYLSQVAVKFCDGASMMMVLSAAW